jgi:hypothetical protein
MTIDHCNWRSVRLALVGGGALIAAAALVCAAQAAGPFDGTYTGQAALVSGNNGAICKTFATSITVTDGRLSYVHGSGYAIINTDVAADGSFNGSGPIGSSKTKGGAPALETLQGKVSGSAIEADAAGPACAFHLSLRKAR